MSEQTHPEQPVYIAGIEAINAVRRLRLSAGTIDEPIVLTGLRGTPDDPVIIEGILGGKPSRISPRGAPTICKEPVDAEPDRDTDRDLFETRFSCGLTEEEFRIQANELAKRREAGGHYPTIAEIADQAMLKLVDCQHVIVRNLYFLDAWPTAIYLDNCQFITLDTLRFDRCTYGIGANGSNTHDLLVQNCRYWQNEDMWESVSWTSVHGSPNNGGHVQDCDNRHLDGDFFRSWNIFGNVTIRNNWIGNCFNGVHLFAAASGRHYSSKYHKMDKDSAFQTGGIGTELDTLATVNVLIENNVFYKVLDNCVEPEDFAWNWVVRYNRFDSCYIPFSFGQKQGGWFYIYGNTGDLTASPSSKVPKKFKKNPRLMKLPKKQNFGGPIYMFHNSWKLKKKHFGKRILRGLRHENNLVWFKSSLQKIDIPKLPFEITLGGMFGNTQVAGKKDSAFDEGTNFTRRWDELDISFARDVTNDVLTLQKLPKLPITVPEEFEKLFKKGNYWSLGYKFSRRQNSPFYHPHVFSDGFEAHSEILGLKPHVIEVEVPRRFGADLCRVLELARAKRRGALQDDNLPFQPGMKLYSEDGTEEEPVDDFPFLPDITPQLNALAKLDKLA